MYIMNFEFTVLQFFILCLAVFRLTHLLVFDKITEFIRSPFFDEIVEVNEIGEEEVYLVPKKGGIKGFFGELLSCYWCSGIWASIILYIGYIFIPFIFGPIITILAIAGVAALFEAIIQRLIIE